MIRLFNTTAVPITLSTIFSLLSITNITQVYSKNNSTSPYSNQKKARMRDEETSRGHKCFVTQFFLLSEGAEHNASDYLLALVEDVNSSSHPQFPVHYKSLLNSTQKHHQTNNQLRHQNQKHTLQASKVDRGPKKNTWEIGVQELADAIRLLMGPKGSSVLREHNSEALRTTTEGVTVARGIEFHERITHKSSNLGQQATNATADVVVTNLRSSTWIIYTLEEIIQVRTISANEVREIDKLIAKATKEECKKDIISIAGAAEILSARQQHKWFEQNRSSYKTIVDVYGRANLRHDAQALLTKMSQIRKSTALTLLIFLLYANSKAVNAEQTDVTHMATHSTSAEEAISAITDRNPIMNYEIQEGVNNLTLPNNNTRSITISQELDQTRANEEIKITDLLTSAAGELRILGSIAKIDDTNMDTTLGTIAQQLVLDIDKVGLKMVHSYQLKSASSAEPSSFSGRLKKEDKKLHTFTTATALQPSNTKTSQLDHMVIPLWSREISERDLSPSLLTDEKKQIRIKEEDGENETKEKEFKRGTNGSPKAGDTPFPNQILLFHQIKENQASPTPMELVELLALKLAHRQDMAATQLKDYGTVLLPSEKSRELNAHLLRVYPRGQGIFDGGVLLQARGTGLEGEKVQKREMEIQKNELLGKKEDGRLREIGVEIEAKQVAHQPDDMASKERVQSDVVEGRSNDERHVGQCISCYLCRKQEGNFLSNSSVLIGKTKCPCKLLQLQFVLFSSINSQYKY